MPQTNLSSLAITDAELDVMAHGLAYDGCCSVIESTCPIVVRIEQAWFDTTPDNVYVAARKFLADAVIYLEARGLLERHDDNPNWVSLNDESEGLRPVLDASRESEATR